MNNMNQGWIPKVNTDVGVDTTQNAKIHTHIGASIGTDTFAPVSIPTGGYFRRLAKCIHQYSHGAPFFHVTVDDDGTWYTFGAHPGDVANGMHFRMPVSLNVIEPSRTEEFFKLLKDLEDTYEKFIDLKYIKNIAHKLTSDERKRVQKWIANGNSIENL